MCQMRKKRSCKTEQRHNKPGELKQDDSTVFADALLWQRAVLKWEDEFSAMFPSFMKRQSRDNGGSETGEHRVVVDFDLCDRT